MSGGLTTGSADGPLRGPPLNRNVRPVERRDVEPARRPQNEGGPPRYDQSLEASCMRSCIRKVWPTICDG
jgi:hypothetical protein